MPMPPFSVIASPIHRQIIKQDPNTNQESSYSESCPVIYFPISSMFNKQERNNSWILKRKQSSRLPKYFHDEKNESRSQHINSIR